MTIKGKQFQRTEDGHLLLMSNEERNLLITDLTTRLNYGVICLIERVNDFGPTHRNEKLTGFCFDNRGGFYFKVGGGPDIVFAEKIMPYLRPMSSMTEEEKDYIKNVARFKQSDGIHYDDGVHYVPIYQETLDDQWKTDGKLPPILDDIYRFVFEYGYILLIDFFNSHHLDYRGLIEKGLALEAPKDMYETK